MKLKNKIILTLASCLIAVGSIIHFGFAERSLLGDITLADISMMAQAQTEIPEVIINCNYPGQGRCWKQMSPYPWWQSDCQFTGYQTDYCTDWVIV